MENRKQLRIGRSVVHGRTGPLRGDMNTEEPKKEEIKKEGNNKENIIRNNNYDKKKDDMSNKDTQNNDHIINNEDIINNKDIINNEDIINNHYNKEDGENNSVDIFEQLLQRELAKGALGGGVVEKNTNKIKSHTEKENNIIDTTPADANIDEDAEKLSNISLSDRINSTIVKYRTHAYNEILKCFNENNNNNNNVIDKKIHIVNNLFKDEDSILKYLSDNNLICQLKTSEITEAYLNIIKEIYFHNYKNEYNNEEELITSFVNEYRNKLYNMFLKIYVILMEKILPNAKSFDYGCNIIIKIIEYCSSDKITLSIITTICEYLNSIFLKAQKNVSNIKGVKIKVVASILLLLYRLLNSFGVHIICVKTINKFCFKFNEMLDKSVKTNFYSLYIEMLTQVNITDFHNSILNELSSQQRNYINKELQNKNIHPDNKTNTISKFKCTYIMKTNDHNNSQNLLTNISGNTLVLNGLDNNIVEEFDVFKDICTKQWEKRVLEGCIDKNNSTNNTSNSSSNKNKNNNSSNNLLSNENLLPWKIKVEAINLLCDKMKSKYNIKKTNYLSTLLNIILKLLKSESALPVVVSTLKLLHILIEKFEKDIYNTLKNFSFILCSKLKDSNKQVSNACMECLTKAISVYNIDVFLDDLSKNLKDKNNNTRQVTLDFLLKTFEYIHKKSISSLIDTTKHLLNDTVANIKNTAFKLYALIISYYGESVYSAFFNSLPSNKKQSILSLCEKKDKIKNENEKNLVDNTYDENEINSGDNKYDENDKNFGDNTYNGSDKKFENDINNHGNNKDNINKMTTLKGNNNTNNIKNNISNNSENRISGGNKNINSSHNNNINKSLNVNITNNLEYYLPKDMIKNLGSSNIPNKIEGLQMLNDWIKNEKNIMILNFEELINFIKKNCYEFKGKNVLLNNVIYDIFYGFIDIAYQYNLKNNSSFYKMLNILICLYIEKVTDKKGNMICNNFIHKCFIYFDNNIILDLFLKNMDSKNAKKSEESIKILQKVFINKNKNSNINIKNLIYFLKKFVDSKNTNLKNSSILMLQILSKNFGDKYVLSHLEGISENIRQMVKLKEDVDKFVSRHGLHSSTSILLKDMDRQHSHLNNMTTNNISINPNINTNMNQNNNNINNNNNNCSNVTGCESLNKSDMSRSDNNITNNNQGNDNEIERYNENDNTSMNNTNYINNNINKQNKKEEKKLGTIIKKKDFSLEDEENINKNEQMISPINNTIKFNNIQIDYTNNYLNYNNTNISGNTSMDISKGINNIKENTHENHYQNDEVKNFTQDIQVEEDDEEEKMILIIDHIKHYINQIISDNYSNNSSNNSNNNNNNNSNNNSNNNNNNNISNSVSKIINVIEKIGKYYINPEKLDMLINENVLNKIYNNNKNKCIQLLYVIIFSLKENTHVYADILFEFIVSIIDDIDVSVEQIDKLLTCMCRNLGISKYINHINTYILNQKLNNINDDNNQNNMNMNSNSNNNITDRTKQIKKNYKRNKILIVINNINTNHILLLNESVIKKKILTFYLDLFFDDNEQIRERASIVLDNIYSKYGRNVFFFIYEKLSAHKKECLQDILNQMKLNKDDFSFYKIFLSNNSQLKRISMNESNLSVTTPTVSKTKSVKRLSSFTKNKTMNIDFPANYKIKPDKLKWEKNLDNNHSNYLMKEFKSFATSELISNMFSDKPNIINRSISFFKDYISSNTNQSTIFSKSGFLDLLLKWIYYTLNGHKNNNEILSSCINLIRIILKTIEDNYVFLNESELVTLVNFLFDKINTSTVSQETREKLKEIFLCLCYISDHQLYFNLLLKSLSSCDQRKLCDSLDIILKLLILYKEKCINIEKDIMKILQVFTVHSKNKTVTIYCLKIFANIQSFYPNFYKCIENDEISFYLKSKVDEFIENCPNFNLTVHDTENDENHSSHHSDNTEGNSKDVEVNEFVNYIKNNANKRTSIKKEVEDHVNGFNKDVEEILEIKKKIEEFEIHKTNDDYINNQISYTSISNDLNFVMEGNNYSKTKEINNIMESNFNEKIKGLNNYNNSIIYFKFVHLTSLLYSNDIETISKVCNIIVDKIVYLGKKSSKGNFILKENGNYIFKNLNLFIILLKGANYALRYLFRENFGSDLNCTSVHLNAILNTLLLLDILMKKKSCVEKLSFDHFSFFFINTIVCLSIYTKVIYKHNNICRIKDGEIARNLITSILNNLLGREFLSNHTKLLEYVCNVAFNLGFDIIKNNNILLDEMQDTSEFYIYINTYVKILNKIYKKIINKIFDENTTDSRFVYKILNILFMNLNKYDMYICKMETDKNRKRKMDSEHEENRNDERLGIISGIFDPNHNINNNNINNNNNNNNNKSSNNNKKICNEKSNNSSINNNKENNIKSVNNFNNRFNHLNQKNSINNIKNISVNNKKNNNSSSQKNFSFNQNNTPIEQFTSFNNTNRNSNSCYGYNENEVACNKSDYSIFDCHGTYCENLNIEENNADIFVKSNYEEIEEHMKMKKMIREYSKEEIDKINMNKIDFMNKFLFFIQLIFYGIKKNNPLILLAYINHELIGKYHDNFKYYFKKMEILLNKDLRDTVSNIKLYGYSELYTLPFSFDKFINEYNYLKEQESSMFQSYNNVLEICQHFDSEEIYNNFDLSIDDVIQKKKNFLDSLKMIDINEIAFNDNKYEHLKETILQYINELENKQLFCDIKNAQYLSNYEFISTMYTSNIKLNEEMDNKNIDKQKIYTTTNMKNINDMNNNNNNNNDNNINPDRQGEMPFKAEPASIYSEEKNNIQFTNNKKSNKNILNNKIVEDNYFSENRIEDKNKMNINDKDYVTHLNVDKKLIEQNIMHDKINGNTINDTQKFEYFCNTAYDKFKEEIQEERNIMTNDKKEEIENKKEMFKNITTNDATHISHSIYLRNCTVENIDMNKINNEHHSTGPFSKSITTMKEEKYVEKNNYSRENTQNIETNNQYEETNNEYRKINEFINNDKKASYDIEQNKNNSNEKYQKDGALNNFNNVFSLYNNNNNDVINDRNTCENENKNVFLHEDTCKGINNKEYNHEEQKCFKNDHLYKDLFENKGDINIVNKIKENEEKYTSYHYTNKVKDKRNDVDEYIKKETSTNTSISINDDDIRKEKIINKNNNNNNNNNNNKNDDNNNNNYYYYNESTNCVLKKDIASNDKNENIIKNTNQTFLRSNKSNVKNLIKKYDTHRESPNVSNKTTNSIKQKRHLENTKIVNKTNDTFLHDRDHSNVSNIRNRSNISHSSSRQCSESKDTFKSRLKHVSNNSYHNINNEKEKIKSKGGERSTSEMLVVKSNIGSDSHASNISSEQLSSNTTKNNNTHLNKKNHTYIEKSKHIYGNKNTNIIVSKNNNLSENYMQNKEYDNRSNRTSNNSTKRKNYIGISNPSKKKNTNK
ncbi:conserved Plasmodium protein, unknown function [Plasmodium sp. gorilla clade G2]|uniref:conserved Plasmodium protein, unknown function n=1 Tax=Plasmodium sp. gorilla clade G2 TaxID=880535 RepID=UPI000D1FDBC7|nr:conserved Plasmodium protein, unknown function [Plasmodium sp. gorilla clade G2]SOV17714.1 conserved Plasmodium protein, unknown function [Plasmodium sp. gorilla clade G2]